MVRNGNGSALTERTDARVLSALRDIGGDKPPLYEVADRAGVSLTTLRKSIQRTAGLGIVGAGKKAYVTIRPGLLTEPPVPTGPGPMPTTPQRPTEFKGSATNGYKATGLKYDTHDVLIAPDGELCVMVPLAPIGLGPTRQEIERARERMTVRA